ncbi:MAG: thioredoxin family protein [Gemmatimonadaceae bacterium]|nr:thioredoxin family protein [Gemmatimonadaceae bacterium]
MSSSPPTSGGWRAIGVIAFVLVAGLVAARVLDRDRAASISSRAATTSITDEAPPSERVLATALFPSAAVHDRSGSATTLGAEGQPAVLMINSTSCGYCKQSLADLGQLAKGRPLPGLRVLTLEGAESGVSMLEAAGVRGAAFIGPATDQARVLFTFRIQGTPTFIAIDGTGGVRRIMPGYPGTDELRRWLPVMERTADWRLGS